MELNFKSFLELPPACIFALVNNTDKRVYVAHTTRLPTRLGEMVDRMKLGTWKFPAMTEDRSKLELVILETNTEQKYFIHYYLEQYRKQGYSIYNETENMPRGYTFQIQYSFDTRTFDISDTVSVVAVNSQNEKITLGKFDHPAEARKFIDEVIEKNNPAGSLVYRI